MKSYRKTFFASLSVAAGLTAGSASAATSVTITPNSAANSFAFEAEIGSIDNSFGTPGIGWEVDVATSPAGPSSGSYVTNTEDTIGNLPTNTLTFSIDFQKTGSYRLWYRVAYQTTVGTDNRTATGNNDSFYYENGTIGDGSSFRERNSIPVSTTAWTWQGGPSNDITVNSTGAIDWIVAGREDGLVIDRFALVHSDESASVNAAFLDGLDNAPTANAIPEPMSAAMALFGLGALAIRRRR